MAKHTVRIMNFNLTLTSDDDKTYIEGVAQKVERDVKALAGAMPTRNMTEVALFLAMDYYDRYKKSLGDGTNMRGQIKDYLKDSSFARQQLEETKKENELLKAENEKLRARINGTENAEEKEPEVTAVAAPAPAAVKAAEPAPAPEPEQPAEREAFIPRKKNKGKKKENKQSAPVKGVWGGDAFSESADAAADIMSFFEDRAFADDDDED